MRAKNLKVAYCRSATGQGDLTEQKKMDRRLAAYREARAQGVQPAGSKPAQVEKALEYSNRYGVEFNASTIGRLDDKFTQTVLAKAD